SKHATVVNYAVGPQYNGGEGVQIGSTGKVYVMVTALEQGIPFGYTKNVGFSATVDGYTNCKGQATSPWQVHNDESEKGGHHRLDQRVLRLPGAEGRLVQRGPHRRQDGPDLARREVAAEGRPQGTPLAQRGQPPVVYARRGQRRPDRRRGLGRRPPRPRYLLQADRGHQDPHHGRRQAAGGVGRLPPGAVDRGRGRGQLHPP